MDDVINPEAVTNETVETETTTPSAQGETETGEPKVEVQQPQQDGSEKSNQRGGDLNQALRIEREQRKALQRELAQLRGQGALANFEGDDMEQVLSHPFVQDQMLKIAEYQIKEGVDQILDNYPNLPKAVVNAIKRNPRGYVQPDTQDVQSALLDIQDYLEEVYPEFETQNPQPINVLIAKTNSSNGTKSNADAQIKQLLNKPPEELSAEEAKLLEASMNK